MYKKKQQIWILCLCFLVIAFGIVMTYRNSQKQVTFDELFGSTRESSSLVETSSEIEETSEIESSSEEKGRQVTVESIPEDLEFIFSGVYLETFITLMDEYLSSQGMEKDAAVVILDDYELDKGNAMYTCFATINGSDDTVQVKFSMRYGAFSIGVREDASEATRDQGNEVDEEQVDNKEEADNEGEEEASSEETNQDASED